MRSCGSPFAGTDKNSTKYATKYSNNTTTYYGTKIYEVGKTGDATKESYTGSGFFNWFGDFSYFLFAIYPFFLRGGEYGNVSTAGVFRSYSDYGGSDENVSFRLVLAL